MPEFQQIGVLQFSKPKNYTLWVALILLLIMLAFLLFAASSESKSGKIIPKPKSSKNVNSSPHKGK
jgi:hypothetical protein